MRYKAKMILDRFSRKAIHPVAGVPGGFIKPLLENEQEEFSAIMAQVLDFVLFALDYSKKEVFPQFQDQLPGLGTITTGFIGAVDKQGALNLYDGQIRLMKSDTSYIDFDPADYKDYLGEKVVPFSYGKFPYAKTWNEGFSLNSNSPKGIYRSNTLARINVADHISTPRAQEELELFREKFGRPAQATL
ncbi:MAG: Ni/Fe hydrogenase subunit alpha, partial [Desulfobulbaceae bacterium]|nr:Ni/Fe hydrogenase subunit alpha [Desulfobulbaceae bacterium]